MSGIDGQVDSAASDLYKKKLHSARRRRQEIMRIRSSPSASDGFEKKRISAAASSSDDSATGSESIKNSSLSVLASASYGHVSVVGRRREMEDTVTVAPALAAGGYDFFGVYDGHGGTQVAACCRDRMHLVLADVVAAGGGGWPDEEEGEEGRWREVMGECFRRVDGEAEAGDDRTVGSTAVVALVGAASIVVANCGDSRAVLSRGGVAVPLSQDHKPDRPDEMERVEAAGGKVINWDGYRVIGVLATSRSIGDYYLKPYVTSEPEVTITNRTEKDEFLILASDGLWDVISNEMACKITRQCLNGQVARMFPHTLNGSTASEAAALLSELAISRGSTDNISVVVVELKLKIRGLLSQTIRDLRTRSYYNQPDREGRVPDTG